MANVLERLATIATTSAPRLKSALPTIGGVALLVVAAVWTYLEFFGAAPETYGQLVVDSPEIYTRERLVNDRFVEDAWLRRKLRDSGAADFTPTGGLAQRESSALRVAWGAEAGGEPGAPAAARDIARRDAGALFRSELTYRGEIRNMIIENQLDDRHDLRGNSLYRLKFDASVLPGDNTRANALISVTLEEPPHQALGEKDLFFVAFDPEELKRWRLLFSEWLRDIGDSINQVVTDLKYDYATHRFPREYLSEFFATMERCDNYDPVYYKKHVQPLMEDGEADLGEIFTVHIEAMRQELGGCSATAAATRQISGTLAAMKDGEPAAAAEDSAQATADADSAPATRTASAPSPDGGAVPARSARGGRQIKIDAPRKNNVSLNELIHRFAAPRLFQLTFGRGAAGVRASGSVGVWTFFHPYATLTAFYALDENAFQLRANKTTLAAFPAPQPISEDSCGETSVLIPWDHGSFWPWQKTGFCLTSETDDIETFLTSMNVTLAAFPAILAGDPALRKRLDHMVAKRDKPVPIVVESGLFAFIRDLQRASSVFSYAVTPKQSVQSLVVDDQTSRQAAVAGGADGVGAQLGGDRSIGFSGVREQPLVVGYGNALGGSAGQEGDGAKIEFGWFISPPVQGADGAGLHKVHAAAQYALTALVSVPAWWDQIDLKVERAWLGHDGRKIPVNWPDTEATDDAVVTIDLPRDLESISASLFDRAAGPEIEEGKMETIALTVCRPAAILLPGRRLWRSAVVTLGAQPADEIQVLPNMRGIIAKFDRIAMPSGWSGVGTEQVPVTVWTSEGSRTLRDWARIRMPTPTRGADPDVLTTNGTCRPEPSAG